MAFKLDGTEFKDPGPGFKISKYKLTKNGRLAGGLMTMDIVALKKKFYFSYDVISSTELQVIEDIIDDDVADAFYVLTYEEDGTEKTATVYAGAIDKTLARNGSVTYWRDVSFDLIEQ